MSQTRNAAIAVIGIDIGKNSFHIVGLDDRGAIVLRQKWSRGQVEARLANVPPCLIGIEACVGAHHLSRKLQGAGARCAQQPDVAAAREPLVVDVRNEWPQLRYDRALLSQRCRCTPIGEKLEMRR